MLLIVVFEDVLVRAEHGKGVHTDGVRIALLALVDDVLRIS